MKERGCEAEHHENNCPCQRCGRNNCGNCRKTNVDHFTAKYVAKEWHRVHRDSWGENQTNKESNLQHLSFECHAAKDASTPARRDILRRLHNGEYISLAEYERIIRRFD